MHRTLVWLVTAFVVVLAGIVEAQTGPYFETGLGVAVAPSLTVHGSDNDWSTKCDLIINPHGVEVAPGECDAAPPPSSWANPFSAGVGPTPAVTFGYDWGALRLEAEYFHRLIAYNERSNLDIFDEVSLDKHEQEIEVAVGSVGDLQAGGVFANAYWDFGPESAPWNLYVGAGVGAERARLDYGTVWKRNDDPTRIATFIDPELRAKLAGTTTIGDARLTDVIPGYQLLAGVDFPLRDAATLGLKVRWAAFGVFESDPTPWDQLRSHESSVGRGETIHYEVTTADSRFLGVSLSLKYRF